MPRVPAVERLHELARAATDDFGRLGYRGTKTADVGSQGRPFYGFALQLRRVEGGALPSGLPSLGFELTVPTPSGPARSATPRPRRDPRRNRGGTRSGTDAAYTSGAGRGAAGRCRTGSCARSSKSATPLLEHYWPLIAVIERCAVEMPDLGGRVVRAWPAPGSFEELGSLSGAPNGARGCCDPCQMLRSRPEWSPNRCHGSPGIGVRGEIPPSTTTTQSRRTVVEFVCAALVPELRR